MYDGKWFSTADYTGRYTPEAMALYARCAAAAMVGLDGRRVLAESAGRVVKTALRARLGDGAPPRTADQKKTGSRVAEVKVSAQPAWEAMEPHACPIYEIPQSGKPVLLSPSAVEPPAETKQEPQQPEGEWLHGESEKPSRRKGGRRRRSGSASPTPRTGVK